VYVVKQHTINNIYTQGHTIYTDNAYPIYINNTYLYNNITKPRMNCKYI